MVKARDSVDVGAKHPYPTVVVVTSGQLWSQARLAVFDIPLGNYRTDQIRLDICFGGVIATCIEFHDPRIL